MLVINDNIIIYYCTCVFAESATKIWKEAIKNMTYSDIQIKILKVQVSKGSRFILKVHIRQTYIKNGLNI